MEQMDICKYLARELGTVLQDDHTDLYVKIGKCYCSILTTQWTIRRIRGRRLTTGESAIGFLLDIHKRNGIELNAVEAAFIVREATAALQAGKVS